MINLRKFWKTVAADDPAAPAPAADPNDPSSTMQILTDGTAQLLCQRLWNGYISDDNTNFPTFMAQIDGICAQFVQSLPVPVDPDTLEDSTYDDSPESLPSIGPTGPDKDEE